MQFFNFFCNFTNSIFFKKRKKKIAFINNGFFAQSSKINFFSFNKTEPYSSNKFVIDSHKNGIVKILYNHIICYPSPANLSYFWSFGSLALFALFIQIISGVFLAMHYAVSVDTAFNSVEHIMRDVSGGWLIRYMHANGASAFFFVVYMHMFRGLMYQSYVFSNKTVWITGMIIFVLMMATAFIGYVLPWGQMSFWGATVITNLFSVIPFLGSDLVYWLWGGFSVGAATLNRFYSFHYLFPFIIVSIVIIHVFYLHIEGSSNPFFIENRNVNIFYLPLFPYFFIKDLIGIIIFGFIISYFIFFNPNALGHSDNYIEANGLVTPEHIVPEWYFLPFYAVLRSIPNKELGIIAMGASLLIFFFIPFINFTIDNNIFFKFFKKNINVDTSGNGLIVGNYYFSVYDKFSRIFMIIYFSSIFFFLGFIGARPVEYPFVNVGAYTTFIYFYMIFFSVFFSFSSDEFSFNTIFFKNFYNKIYNLC